MSDDRALRQALLELHRVLLDGQRIEAERFGGRMTSAELLQAAADDLRFSWLKELSELISGLNEGDVIITGVVVATPNAPAGQPATNPFGGGGRRF